MNRDRRFGKRIAAPSSVQIVHELKLMALRHSLDAAIRREAVETLPGDRDTAARDSAAPPSIIA